jgi:hypothetical protein
VVFSSRTETSVIPTVAVVVRERILSKENVMWLRDSRILTLVLLLLAGSSVPGVAETTPLDALRARYSRIRSIHFVARAHPWVAEEKKPTASGMIAFEYWADGDRYRMKCHSDPGLGLTRDMEVAFDGTYWQMLDVPASTIHFQRQESQQVPIACPNPLFLALDFLSPDTEECPACGIRLRDLSDGGRWESMKLEEPKTMSGSKTTEYRITTRSVGGPRKSYSIELGRESGVIVVSSLRRLYESGRKEVELVVDEFRTLDPRVGPLPVRMRMKSFDESGKTTMAGPWRIDTIEVNQPIDDDVFTLDWKSAKAVWDSDAKVFVTHWDDRVRNRKLSQENDCP